MATFRYRIVLWVMSCCLYSLDLALLCEGLELVHNECGPTVVNQLLHPRISAHPCLVELVLYVFSCFLVNSNNLLDLMQYRYK